MSEPIVFYDFPRNVGPSESQAWNPNTWKTRYTLNIKGIPYKTVWVEYPDVAPLCKKIGASPTDTLPDGNPLYTLPVIYDPNTKRTVSDSAAIARYLDKTYPSTHTLVPKQTDALHAAFNRAFLSTLFGGGDVPAIMMPPSNDKLNARSEAYFRATREVFFNSKLEDLAPPGSEKEKKAWAGTKAVFHTYAEWFEADGEEKLFVLGGDDIAYADVTFAAFLTWIELTLGEDSEKWKELITWDNGRWAKLVAAFKKYRQVDAGSLVEL